MQDTEKYQEQDDSIKTMTVAKTDQSVPVSGYLPYSQYTYRSSRFKKKFHEIGNTTPMLIKLTRTILANSGVKVYLSNEYITVVLFGTVDVSK